MLSNLAYLFIARYLWIVTKSSTRFYPFHSRVNTHLWVCKFVGINNYICVVKALDELSKSLNKQQAAESAWMNTSPSLQLQSTMPDLGACRSLVHINRSQNTGLVLYSYVGFRGFSFGEQKNGLMDQWPQNFGDRTATVQKTNLQRLRYTSSPITVALEVEPQLENVVVKLTAKSPLVWIFPLAVYNLESNILHTNSKLYSHKLIHEIRSQCRSITLYINIAGSINVKSSSTIIN